MREHLPADSVVAVHPGLAESVSLPRNARSWRREAASTQSADLRTRAAIKAAARLPGPRYDVIFSPPDRSLSRLPSLADHDGAVHYIVVPDGRALSETVSRDVWLVARFRSSASGGSGVAILGTQASPQVVPVHVEWRMARGRMLATRPPAL
jgi:hypothetical protein